MRKRTFGEPVAAPDLEEMGARGDHVTFVRLCCAMIGAEASRRMEQAVLPVATDRINLPDGGVDASLTLPAATKKIEECGGLVGPGKAVYQFKSRSVTNRGRSKVVSDLGRKVADEIGKFAPTEIPDRYILMTNVQLQPGHHQKLIQALKSGQPLLADRPCVVWDANQIASFLDTHPPLRHIFFAEGSLTTLEVAEEELQSSYRQVGWPRFTGRERELVAIGRFVGSDKERLLVVHGPAYAGKTRLVIEGLKPQGARVAWASVAGSLTLDHFRDMDQVDQILVVDTCDPGSLRDLSEWALARKHVKIVLISSEAHVRSGSLCLALGPLARGETDEMLKDIAPGTPPFRQAWLRQVSGDLPGLLCLATISLRADDPEASSVSSFQQFLTDVENRFTQDLTEEERGYLPVFSFLPFFEEDIRDGTPLIAFCEAIKLYPGRLLPVMTALKKKGILQRRGAYLEVAPVLLGDVQAESSLDQQPGLLHAILSRLAPQHFDGIFERLARIPGNSDRVEGLRGELFSRIGIFPNLETLLERSERFRRLAPAAPGPAAAALNRLLSGLTAEQVNERIAQEALSDILSTLEHLLLRPASFGTAAGLLLLLAEANSEREAQDRVKQIFLRSFNYLWPESAVPFDQRVQFLETFSDPSETPQPMRRRLVALAAGQAIAVPGWIMLRTGAAEPGVPPAPERPRTGGEARSLVERVLTLLIRLVDENDPLISPVARHEITRSFQNLLDLAWDRERFQPLAEAALTAIERVHDRSETAPERIDVISQLERYIELLGEPKNVRFGRDIDQEPLRDMVARLSQLRSRLVQGGWSSELRYHAGPASWRQTRERLETSGGRSQSHERAAAELAQRTLTDPDLLTNEVLDWLVSEEAENSRDFFKALGRLHETRSRADEILARPSAHFGPEAFGWYIQGWAETGPDCLAAVADYLDSLARDRPDLAIPILDATLRCPASARAVDRILGLVSHRVGGSPDFVRWMIGGFWPKDLSAAEFERLVIGLDDGSTKRACGLVKLLSYATERIKPLTPRTIETAWSVLAIAAESVTNLEVFAWDVLAAHLGREEPSRLGDLIGRFLKSPRHEIREISKSISLLRKGDRPALITSLLTASQLNVSIRFALHSQLEELFDLEKDADTLLQWIRDHGVGGVESITFLLGAGHPAFVNFCRSLLRETHGDHAVKTALLAVLGRLSFYEGNSIRAFEERLQRLRHALAREDDQIVREWLTEAKGALEAEVSEDTRFDRKPPYFWDAGVSRSDVERIVSEPDTPVSAWVIRRLLESAPPEEVFRLLRLEQIEGAMEDTSLDPAARRRWKAYLESQTTPR